MPELNPYEVPQSVDTEVSKSQPREEEYPRWIKKTFDIQMTLIVGLFILSMIITGPPKLLTEIIAIVVIIVYTSLAISLFLAAISYRIIWLIIVEFILIVPLLGFLM